MKFKSLLLGACASVAMVASAQAVTLTIATVNNGDMIRMQKLTDDFKKQNPDIDLKWVTLEENVLRQRVTTDIATHGGQYDIMTIGNYEVPIWAKQDWLVQLDDLGDNYDADDILPSVKKSISVKDKLYAAPFYGESAFTMYRTDLFKKAGLEMPEKPTWEFIKKAADKITDKDKGIYGICLRGKAGWGENMAFVTALANSWGARWFDMDWKPQFDSDAWKGAAKFYVDLLKQDGPPGASSNGFNENLALFQSGKCGMWMDATVAASFISDPKESKVADSVGYALFPTHAKYDNHGNWLWSWNLAIPAGTKHEDAAKKFIAWATSKHYTDLVAQKDGWSNVPPGTRQSLYANKDYLDKAPFAKLTLQAMQAVNPNQPTVDKVPYKGSQFVSIPEFQAIGTAVGQQFSAAVAGQTSVDQALQNSQQLTTREMTKAGYIK
ncbi:ABC transporter substrate-binding protein [Pararhizobium mangrovi]|uniref:Sugar ABC transporter substrate-binding protein n=1 Tax=Pararhizobium mangrovi TaxID=2590452 RepID=A0A506U2X7_9HYPH|nr:sugar ABC transporter substrate-binding protein [Pararhizobium mangrovi]TPW28160.1 sugar ABC transporter substrate-binding protein [Pararhizobium mangrovi]